MKLEIKKALLEKKKQNRERVSALRNKLQEELEKECEQNGGHKFWHWQENPCYSIGGFMFYTHIRNCSVCGKVETKKEYE